VTRMSTLTIALALASAVGCAAPEAERTARGASALVIQAQGSFAVGGDPNVVAGHAQGPAQNAGDVGVVFHDEHPGSAAHVTDGRRGIPR